MKRTHPVLRLLNAPRPSAAVDFDPAWRWNRAAALAKMAAYLPRRAKRADRLLYRAFHFFRRAQGLDGRPVDRSELAITYPDIHEAFQLFNNPNALRSRQILEALLMSGEEPARIIDRYPTVQPRVLAVFEGLFFDVRGLLRDRLFILNNVLGPILEGRGAQDHGLMLKFIAYLGGSDMLLRYLDGSLDFTPDQLESLCGVIRKQITMNTLNAATSVRVTQGNAISLQDLHRKYEEDLRAMEMAKLGPAERELEELTGDVITGLQTMFGAMPVKPYIEDTNEVGSFREPGLYEQLESNINQLQAAPASAPKQS